MKKGQDTRGYERYLALDIHREYILVGGWNEKKEWVLTPRRVGQEEYLSRGHSGIGNDHQCVDDL
jgi:hypothetical protein